MTNKMIEQSTEKCTAMTATSGYTKRCTRYSIKGSTVCNRHGGALPNVRRVAQFRLARDKAQQEALARLKASGANRQDTITEMDRLAAEVIVFKDVCREQLDRLLGSDAVRYEGSAGEQLRAEVALYERALDRCNTVLATNVKLGIAERRNELDKAQGIVIVGVIKAILNRLELNAHQKVIAGQVVPEELRAIEAAVT